MSWVKVDDHMPRHPKWLSLGKDRLMCQGVWLDGMCYSSAYLTDGFVPKAALERGSERYAERLVSAGLWDREQGGYRIHDYHDYQPTREQVLASRRKNADRQSRHRNAASNGVTNAGGNGVSALTPYPARPVPGPLPVSEVLQNVPSNGVEWVEPLDLYAARAKRKSLSQKERDWIEDLHIRYSRAELVEALYAVDPGTDYLKRVDAWLESRGVAA